MWFKVDDNFNDSPEVRAIPRATRAAAVGVYTSCGTWSAKWGTDGAIPTHMVEELCGTAEDAGALVACGLWVVTDTGWAWIAWAPDQPLAADVAAKREQDLARQHKHRTRPAETPPATVTPTPVTRDTDVTPNPVTRDSVRPEPEPEPITTTATTFAAERPKRGTRLPTDWKPSEELLAWAAENTPHVNPTTETAQFRDYWSAKPGAAATKLDWPATWRTWMRTASARRPPPAGVIAHLPTRPRPPGPDARAAATLALANGGPR